MWGHAQQLQQQQQQQYEGRAETALYPPRLLNGLAACCRQTYTHPALLGSVLSAGLLALPALHGVHVLLVQLAVLPGLAPAMVM